MGKGHEIAVQLTNEFNQFLIRLDIDYKQNLLS